MHLTNYSLNKHSEKFVHTEELILANDGTKRTLTSYWKSLEEAGHDSETVSPKNRVFTNFIIFLTFWNLIEFQVKKDIVSLLQNMLKALKPFLRYFQRCTFPKGEPGTCFHIIGVDVILDDRLNPWILEINAYPSMNIESASESKKAGEFRVSPIDLHVKSM